MAPYMTMKKVLHMPAYTSIQCIDMYMYVYIQCTVHEDIREPQLPRHVHVSNYCSPDCRVLPSGTNSMVCWYIVVILVGPGTTIAMREVQIECGTVSMMHR